MWSCACCCCCLHWTSSVPSSSLGQVLCLKPFPLLLPPPEPLTSFSCSPPGSSLYTVSAAGLDLPSCSWLSWTPSASRPTCCCYPPWHPLCICGIRPLLALLTYNSTTYHPGQLTISSDNFSNLQRRNQTPVEPSIVPQEWNHLLHTFLNRL